MPKGYGYDKPPKKSSGFKMRGYSYPGTSPLKGAKKQMKKQAQQQKIADEQAKLQESMSGEMSSSDLLTGGPPQYTGSPLSSKPSPMKEPVSFIADLGTKVLETAATSAVDAGVNALFKKREKKVTKGADMSGFTSIKMGGSSEIA